VGSSQGPSHVASHAASYLGTRSLFILTSGEAFRGVFLFCFLFSIVMLKTLWG
jgi:hypothetical protein